MKYNERNMDRKGMRRTSLSRNNEIDAGEELHIPLKLFWLKCMLSTVIYLIVVKFI